MKTEGEYFYRKNYNPWAPAKVGDCMIRALSAALAMKYEAVCRHLGAPFRPGFGLDNGMKGSRWEAVEASDLAGDYLGEFKMLQANGGRHAADFKHQLMPKARIRVNLNDFCEAAGAHSPGAVFVVLTEGWAGSYVKSARREGGHAVAVFAERGRPYFVDSWDSGDMLVIGYAKVLRQVDPSSPERISMREFAKGRGGK